MQARHPALWAAATTGMLVGAAMVSTSVLSPAASPASLAFLRYAIGLAIPVTAALLELVLQQRLPSPALLAAIALVLAGLVVSTRAPAA